MATVKIDYYPQEQLAKIAAGDECSEAQWGAIRRFFEERYPELVNNDGARALSLPWWSFLSVRNPFRYVLKSCGVTSLHTSEAARNLLLEARSHEQEYDEAVDHHMLESPEEVQAFLDSRGFTRHLLPFQLRNLTRIGGLSAGATFSVPGSGKTTEALAFYFLNKADDDRLVVIAPKNAFVAWEDELTACVPTSGLSFLRLIGGRKHIKDLLAGNPRAVIISYHQLPRVRAELAAYLQRNRSYVFVDESHRMKKGQDGVHGAVILSLSHLPKRKLILSGTPMPNSPSDMVPQFSFLYPEVSSKPDTVIDKFRSIFVRTTKSELGLIPPKRILQRAPMTAAQDRLYRLLTSDAARHVEGLAISDRARFRKFARCVQHMLQAVSNPALLVNSSLAGHPLLESVLAEGLSSKLQIACDLTRKWVGDGHKVLIWSTFVNTVEHTAELLKDLGAEYIHGGVPTSDDDGMLDSRETKIRAFNDRNSDCQVLVANPAACSEGISLHHVCHHAIYIDRNYNAAQYLQSEDRIHRIGLGSDAQTFITILCSPGTVDESVDRRLQAKVTAMRRVLDDPDLNIQPLDLDSDDDVAGLDIQDVEDLRNMLRILP